MDKETFIPKFRNIVKFILQLTVKVINIDLSKTLKILCKQLLEKLV